MTFFTRMMMDSGVSSEFITTWNMPSGAVSIPSQTGTYDCTVDWGDGTTSNHTTGALTHTYASASVRQIKITGQYNGFRLSNTTDIKDRILSVDQWGNVGFASFERALFGASNLVSIPNAPITGAENVTSFYLCFRATSITSIAPTLFANCPLVTDFNYCFGFTPLTLIPDTLFANCPRVTTFAYCFASASITSIPPTLFANCPLVTTFAQCFSNCTLATGAAPTLWLIYPSASGTSCFYNCTGLSNYASIPAGWK